MSKSGSEATWMGSREGTLETNARLCPSSPLQTHARALGPLGQGRGKQPGSHPPRGQAWGRPLPPGPRNPAPLTLLTYLTRPPVQATREGVGERERKDGKEAEAGGGGAEKRRERKLVKRGEEKGEAEKDETKKRKTGGESGG